MLDNGNIDALWELSETELEQQLEDIAPEDLDYLRRRWRAVLDKHGVTEDAQESQLARSYLDRYTYEGLIPAGKGWVKLSAAQRAGFLEEPAVDAETDETPSDGLPRAVVIGGFIFAFVIFLLLFSRVLSGGGGASVAELPTPTDTPTLTPTSIATHTPTPTPLALRESDRFVGGGQRSNRTFFPVMFTVDVPGDAQPRVFVVQERVVNTSEWHYETNPDVASWVSGMLVQPVIGIPFSDANADLMERLIPGTTFTLRMNTGAELRFEFASMTQVGRQDTIIFRQREPGLALVLIGETDNYGSPTLSRPVALANYLPEQELAALGGTRDMPTPTLIPTPPSTVNGLDVQLRAVRLDGRSLYVDARFFNPQREEVTISSDDLWVIFGFVSQPNGVQHTPVEFSGIRVASGMAMDTTIHFAWNGSDPYATLNLAGWTYSVTLLGE